mgnify:CR=1 FL=1
MKILMFKKQGTRYLLLTESVYDWSFLQNKYPEISNSAWIFDRFADIDSTSMPLDILIKVDKVPEQETQTKQVISDNSIKSVLGLTDEIEPDIPKDLEDLEEIKKIQTNIKRSEIKAAKEKK